MNLYFHSSRSELILVFIEGSCEMIFYFHWKQKRNIFKNSVFPTLSLIYSNSSYCFAKMDQLPQYCRFSVHAHDFHIVDVYHQLPQGTGSQCNLYNLLPRQIESIQLRNLPKTAIQLFLFKNVSFSKHARTVNSIVN